VLTIRLATGNRPSRRTCQVARLLGARHLAQATLTALTPLPGAFVAGAGADALHAASMLILAAVDRPARRAALTDTAAEAAFAAAGLAAASRGNGPAAPLPTGASTARLKWRYATFYRYRSG